jgi:hypothetical protein
MSKQLPAHPAREEVPTSPRRSTDWAAVVVVAVIATLLVGLVVLHLTGVVGPGAHP